MKGLRAVDLFCGAGGSSTGLQMACDAAAMRLDLTAVNHWDVAVETHAKNHGSARHLCESLDSVDPRKVIPGGRLDVLVASPECIHHSNARGGKPMNDQSRSTAWHVIRWAEALRPRWVLVENVREFLSWGPLSPTTHRPLKSKRGELFAVWRAALTALGYSVDVRVLNSADYGAATTRRRLFVLARLDGGRLRGPLPWPEPTHAQREGTGLFDRGLEPWRAARDVIDWSLVGKSIFTRRKPLSEKTIARIAEGLRRFGGAAAEPFILHLNRPNDRATSVNAPIQTITATSADFGLIEPFMLGQQSGSVPRLVSDPLPTLATDGAVSLVQPFLIPTGVGERQGQTPRTFDLGKPLPTIVGTSKHALLQPFLVPYYGACAGGDSVEDPLRTLTTKDRLGLCEPMIADILFRMLQPHECSRGMGFPEGYQFAGNRGDIMRQVGNAVEVHQARALCDVMVSDLSGRQERAA